MEELYLVNELMILLFLLIGLINHKLVFKYQLRIQNRFYGIKIFWQYLMTIK